MLPVRVCLRWSDSSSLSCSTLSLRRVFPLHLLPPLTRKLIERRISRSADSFMETKVGIVRCRCQPSKLLEFRVRASCRPCRELFVCFMSTCKLSHGCADNRVGVTGFARGSVNPAVYRRFLVAFCTPINPASVPRIHQRRPSVL